MLCPIDSQQSEFTATVMMLAEGTEGPPLLQFAVNATVNLVGGIGIDSMPSAATANGMLAGDTANLNFTLISTLQNLVIGTFSSPAGDQSPFSSQPVIAAVGPHAQMAVVLPVICAPDATPGPYVTVDFVFTSEDGSVTSRVTMRLDVLASRAASVVSNLGQEVSIAPGVPAFWQIQGYESGGINPFEFALVSAPEGIRLELGPMATETGGTGRNNLSSTLPVTIYVDAEAPVGIFAAPIVLTWFVAADAIHPEVSGTVTLNVDVTLPEEVTLSEQILTPSGTALGGTATITLRSDGSYTFSTHMHDSGLDGYSFQIRAALTSALGVHLVAQHSGSVAGSIESGNSDDDFSETKQSSWIYENWLDARTVTLAVSKSYEDTGLLGEGELLLKDLLTFIALDVVAGPVVAAVIVLGNELTAATGTAFLTPGAFPGIIVAVGTAWLLGPDMLFPALVDGVAAGALLDAMIEFREMTDAEKSFADTVFQGQVPFDRIWLTNLSKEGKAFTWPSPDGSILMNLGAEAYVAPQVHAFPGTSYTFPGQILIHEMTHAWQITHSSFSPGLACERLADPSYSYGPPGPPFSTFTVEGQASIVDQWFGGDRPANGHVAGTGISMDTNDVYYPYIVNNIRSGDS